MTWRATGRGTGPDVVSDLHDESMVPTVRDGRQPVIRRYSPGALRVVRLRAVGRAAAAGRAGGVRLVVGWRSALGRDGAASAFADSRASAFGSVALAGLGAALRVAFGRAAPADWLAARVP